MEQAKFAPGTIVTASYKTGQYVGEIAEPPGMSKAAVRILAVVQHPEQGNLHHPQDPDVSFFHQRKALAFGEIALVPLETIRSYYGQVPDYTESLRHALANEQERLDRLVRWAERGKLELEQLKQEYAL